MKKTLIALVCGLALALSANNASALAVDDGRYLGEIDPGTPTNPSDEVDYINQLISMGINTNTTIGKNFFDRSANACGSLGGCPPATITGGLVDLAPQGNVVVSGYTWLFAKYGGDSHVWWVGGLDNATIPLNNPSGQGLSHWALFNPTGTPDGGATLGLLGLAMLGLGYLRRRKQ